MEIMILLGPSFDQAGNNFFIPNTRRVIIALLPSLLKLSKSRKKFAGNKTFIPRSGKIT